MSYFASEMTRLMDIRKMSPADVFRVTGIAESTLSRWLNDKQKRCSPADLERLCHCLGRNTREQAGLIRARLLDQCYGPGAELIHIQVGREPMLMMESHRPPLPPKIEAAFGTLRQNFEDPDLQLILIGLAELFQK